MPLRPYQQDSVASIYRYFGYAAGNPLVVLPTGSGKSHVIADFIRGVRQQWGDQRIIMLTHVKELIQQNAEKLLDHWPGAPIGIHAASLNRRDIFEPIIFGSIQSVYRKSHQLGRFNLCLVDEAHLINHKADGMYRKFIAAQREINPQIKVIGFTATPFRTGHGNIVLGDDPLFTDICYEKPLLELVEEGYLSPVISKRTATKIDLSAVHTRGGEFIAIELEAATDQDPITQGAVDEIIRYGADRRSWLIFCTSIKHAEHVRDALRARNIRAAMVTGETPKAERERIREEYQAGEIQAVTNVNVWTTGFDAPITDLVALLRGTQSPGLYIQMVGRGMRLSPDTGKQDCLVLDFAGNVMRHGPIDQIRPWAPSKKQNRPAPTKACPDCDTILAGGVKECPICQHQFGDDTAPHDATATSAAILSSEINLEDKREWLPVESVTYHKHRKRGDENAVPTLRVDYQCGMRRFSEWVCLAHVGFPRAKAMRWWSERAIDGSNAPLDVDEATLLAEKVLREPAQIHIDENGKFPRILSYEYDPDRNRATERNQNPAAVDLVGASHAG